MKRLIITSLMLICFCFGNTEGIGQNETNETVFVCTGKSSVCYHRIDNCRGLDKCSGEIREVPLSAAQLLGRRECKICHKSTNNAK